MREALPMQRAVAPLTPLASPGEKPPCAALNLLGQRVLGMGGRPTPPIKAGAL